MVDCEPGIGDLGVQRGFAKAAVPQGDAAGVVRPFGDFQSLLQVRQGRRRPPPPRPGPSQGQRNGPSGTAEQTREAEDRGDWATAISLKNKRLAEMAREQR
ncbi:hypothetical protein [Lentzea jiangxiensis]|uniref:Uncharacterized protein n=1 Tax=Lentzea jiangxiensis TaxID=641025 RepID=A0A1H0UH11_9PSEU|nr:hypothetical protein [Lentzea jiangxiensis]SDP65464.1 hypothetical protein SAMN05421507_1126 [Lentzea jiangxiensis]